MERTDALTVARPSPATPVRDGRRRVVIDRIWPEIDGGRFPIKRSIGEDVVVTIEMFADGHDLLAGALKFRHVPAGRAHDSNDADVHSAPWSEVPLEEIGNDSWRARFTVTQLGSYEYTAEAWIDAFGSWLRDLLAKDAAGQDVTLELIEGAELIQQAAGRLKPARTTENRATDPAPRVGAGSSQPGNDEAGENLRLLEYADRLRGPLPLRARIMAARDAALSRLMRARPDRTHASCYRHALSVTVDSELARFGAWYEMFPRSCTPDAARSGTFREAEERLPDIAALGFDVVYLPPIHPIGLTHRKGPNNALKARTADPGSPWAIGSAEGGHTAVEPSLGTLDDFDRFVRVANHLGLEVALDIAFQTSPDHQWVREHPEWFGHRPDGTIRHAENPPKKYQDIYPLRFETEQWESLWAALKNVFLFWRSHGVRIFRVDNPHTKSFAFWEWVIGEVRREHPDAIFLSEAFTRPKVMRYLAKAGFSQSYTYFTWRNSAHELREYLTELTKTELQEYMRPNFFANTPDILHEYLQTGGRPAFEVRLILAATLAASYGIYSGYELCENLPQRPGSEEYLDSEKYRIKPRDWHRVPNIRELIARVNQIRRAHPALQQNAALTFHATDNPALLWYSKAKAHSPQPKAQRTSQIPSPKSQLAELDADRVFVVVNTDPHWMQHGWVQMPIWELGIGPRDVYTVEDHLDGARYRWRGEWNYVRLEPTERVAHIFEVHRGE